jgi:hypothetical protein
MRQIELLLLSFLIIVGFSCSKKKESSFAIVVDKISYDEAKNEIEAYALSVEKQGLKTVLIIDEWQQPDSIRMRLKELYQSENKLEGAVFIGEIPIPMLRDCQHFSSAFKMDQVRFLWNRSSVPSDRFYEDFDLQFDYLKQDTVHTLYHYYSLKAESPQRLTPDIYSGRIKPPKGENQYELLRNYLKKVVAFKSNPSKVDQIMFFTGHGYNSQDPKTWMDEKLALSQQFDYLSGQQNFMEYINFQNEEHIKFRLMAELKRKDLDIALLHHHGGPRAQYLDGMPETQSIQDQIEDVKYYLRSKIRYSNKSPEKLAEAKTYYKNRLGVTDSWFDGSFDEKVIKEDSIYNANLDIYIEDHENYFSNVPFIMLDACFTGSFNLDEYLSGEYIFDEGKTIAVQANSVNAFQDKYPDEMVSLLGLGMRLGFWNQMNCTLETHIIGDPTMSFAQFDTDVNVNEWITSKSDDSDFWKKQLSSKYADVQSLALRKLFEIEGADVSDLLLKVFKESNIFPVRTEALRMLSICKDNNFIEAVNLGINDSYELIQRFSTIYMSESGDPSHIPYLVKAILRNNISKRVNYNLKDAVSMFDKEELLAELGMQVDQAEYLLDKPKTLNDLKKMIQYSCDKMTKYIEEIANPETTEKDIYFNIRSFRNKPVHPHLETLISYLDTTSSEKIKLSGIEMLGWFDHSYKRSIISDFCEKELLDESVSDACKKELLKTKNRINTLEQ